MSDTRDGRSVLECEEAMRAINAALMLFAANSATVTLAPLSREVLQYASLIKRMCDE